MRNKILGTLGAKFVSSILNFVITILITQFFGAEGKGEIGIFVLNLTVILMLSDVVGGAGLIYVLPRSDVFKSIVLSYLWAMFSSVFVILLFYVFNFVAAEYLIHLFFLSLLLNFTSININILLGKEKIKQSNVLILIQILTQASIFTLLLFWGNNKSIDSFFISLYGSQILVLLLGLSYIKKQIISTKLNGLPGELKKMFRYGIFIQAGNFLQLMNYRLSYYLLEYYHGTALVGIYSTGASLCEAVWIISNSISRVQYSRISNSSGNQYAKTLSLRLSKLSLLATVSALIPLILLPEKFYAFVFGNDFGSVKIVIYTLFFGVSSLGMTSLFSHYFAGTGKANINTFVSFVGFLCTLLTGFAIIPVLGLAGAGLTSTISYLATSGLLTFYFLKQTGITLVELMPSFSDIRFLIKETKILLNKNPKL